jgi:hypothetical protein
MASFLRPGVYVQETLNPIAPIAGANSNAIGAFIGANDRGPTTPTYLTSWSQYVTKFGGWNSVASNDLPLAVYMFFANGGNGAYVARVTSSTAASAARTLTDRAVSPLSTLSVAANSSGSWGTNIYVAITDSATSGLFNVVVYYKGNTAANIVERWTDLSMDSANQRYAPTVINAASNYILVADLLSASSGNTKNPAVISATQLLGSSLDGTAVGSAEIVASLGVNTPWDTVKQSLILNIPGYTDDVTINAAIAYADGRGDIFVVVDGANDTVANQLTLAASYTATSAAAVYYPRISIADPTLGVGAATGTTKLVGPGGAVVGVYSATDKSRGVFKAPAGLQAKVAGAVSVASLTNTELDSLNSASAPVNAIKFVPGAGIVVMGARTLKTGYVDRYVPVRRTLIYLEKSLKDLTEFAVFEPNDARLWRRIESTVSTFLTGFWSQGGLAGGTPAQAFFVKVDSENNTSATIDNGEVHIEVGVALQRPAEFVVIKIGQFDGGTTVTVA